MWNVWVGYVRSEGSDTPSAPRVVGVGDGVSVTVYDRSDGTMPDGHQDVRFAVLPLPNDDTRSTEFARTMVPHPLVHQELPYDPQYTIYNRRLTAMSMTSGSPDDSYWRLRTQVILRHTAELPIEVRGSDAEKLLDLVFTRDISKTRVGRCTYQFACTYDGGMIIDGVLVRLADDRFWYGQADGDLSPWLQAHAPRAKVGKSIWLYHLER